MSSKVDPGSARRYLLGDLPEAEAIALEQKYFADPEALEMVSAVESDLVDDHAAGRLEPSERARFNEHYLASPRHRRRAAVAGALRRSVAPTVQVARTVRVAALARRPGFRLRPLHLALAACLLAVATVPWLLRPRRAGERLGQTPPPPTASPEAAVEAKSPPPEKEARPPVVAAFAISPLLVRGSGDQGGLRIPPGADEVLLRLGGEPVPGPLAFTLRTVEGKALFSGRAGTARPHLATVRLPAARLPAGDYILTLTSADVNEPLGQYFFRVLPR